MKLSILNLFIQDVCELTGSKIEDIELGSHYRTSKVCIEGISLLELGNKFTVEQLLYLCWVYKIHWQRLPDSFNFYI